MCDVPIKNNFISIFNLKAFFFWIFKFIQETILCCESLVVLVVFAFLMLSTFFCQKSLKCLSEKITRAPSNFLSLTTGGARDPASAPLILLVMHRKNDSKLFESLFSNSSKKL